MRKWRVRATALILSIGLGVGSGGVGYGAQHVQGIRYGIYGTWYQLSDGRIAYDRWVEDSSGTYYIGSNGFAVSGGWSLIEDTWYLFDSKGRLSNNSGWVECDGTWYYSYNDIKPEGWRQIDGKWYYFNEEGAMQKGWINLEGDEYLLGKDGELVYGRWVMSVSTRKKYYILEDGKIAKGNLYIGSKLHQFDEVTGEYLGDN